MVGSSLVRLVPKEQAHETEAALEQVRKRKKAELRDTIGLRKDGTKFHVSVAISPILGADGSITGASAVVRNITDQITLELQRQDVISTLTHDVRSSILAQKRIADLLAGDTNVSPAETKHLLIMLSTSTDSVLSKVSSLVDVCRYSVRSKQDFERFDLSAVVQTCIQEKMSLARRKEITFKSDHVEKNRWIVGDPTAIKIAIENLLDNAIKFTSPGGNVTVSMEKNGSPNLELKISDTGIGISLEGQQNLFHRFWQGDAGRNESGGTGFGLYLCSQIVQAHGGTISCSSRLNAGTTMVMKLPAGQATV
jgi:signal transduction histidine kinase